MIKNKSVMIVTGLLFIFSAQDVPAQTFSYQEKCLSKIIEFLNQKPYTADKVVLTESDLTVPENLDAALNYVGLSFYTLLRNESFARHGYVFKDEVLLSVFTHVDWYKPDSEFRFTQLSRLENKNVEFIKSIETTYDYQNIAKALDGDKFHFKEGFLSTQPNLFDHKVMMSLNHLRLNPSRLLRNLIYAKNGYIFKEPLLKEIFSRTLFYSPQYENLVDATAIMTPDEIEDVQLLEKKEWVDILNSVNINLPSDVISIPTIGYNALFIRKLPYKGETYYYSSQFIHSSLAANAGMLDDHKTDTDKLVTPEIVAQIQAETDPFRKLVLFFDNKKFKGYTDTIVFNHSDMEIPSYLEDAVKDYGVDYLILLRKEIHARIGARFSDKKSGAIFSRCRWYKSRYNLTPRTESRFPADVKIKHPELINFALLEGEELSPKALQFKGKNMVVDLNGNIYFVKVGLVQIPGHTDQIEIGSDFPTVKAYENGSLQEVIDDKIFGKDKTDPNTNQEFEVKFSVQGC